MSVLLQIRYHKFAQVGTEARDVHSKMTHIRDLLGERMDVLRRDGWQADAADDFYYTMTKDVLPGLDRLITALNRMETTVGSAIQIYQRAEENTRNSIRDLAGRSPLDLMVSRIGEALSRTLNESTTPQKLFKLLDSFEGISKAYDAFMDGKPGDLYKLLDAGMAGLGGERDFIENLATWGFGELIQEGVKGGLNYLSAGTGTAAFFVNDLAQVGGSITADQAVFIRELLLGDDPNSRPYQLATESIHQFRDVYHDANLHTPIDSLATVMTTAVVKPWMNQVGRVWESFSQGDYGTALKEGAVLVGTGPAGLMLNEASRNPNYARTLLVDTAGFFGDTVDFGANLPRLPSAALDLGSDMTYAINEKMIDQLPISPETRTALHNASTIFHDAVDRSLAMQTIITSPVTLTGYFFDAGDEARAKVGDVFDLIQGRF